MPRTEQLARDEKSAQKLFVELELFDFKFCLCKTVFNAEAFLFSVAGKKIHFETSSVELQLQHIEYNNAE